MKVEKEERKLKKKRTKIHKNEENVKKFLKLDFQ